jgi:hypothetical protein
MVWLRPAAALGRWQNSRHGGKLWQNILPDGQKSHLAIIFQSARFTSLPERAPSNGLARERRSLTTE